MSGLGGVALAEGDGRRGALLLAAAETAFERMGVPMDQTDRDAHDGFVAEARCSLPAETFEKAWQEGSSLLLDAAVALAVGHRERLL